MQASGVFSIDRDGIDRKAFKIAQEILVDKRQPLVIFPEGEVYHCNDRVTPFREGAMAIAASAARKANRKIFVVPCALKYHYLDDPTPELNELMDQLEAAIHWRPRTGEPLQERIYPLAGALMSLKELEYLGKVRHGDLPDRTRHLADHILTEQETRHEVSGRGLTIPERVKEMRRRAIQAIEKTGETEQIARDLDDLFLAIQLFSYPGNYVAENPTIERIAETLDKFEEDVLRRYSSTTRGRQKVTIRFGDPIEVPVEKRKADVSHLTDLLERTIQGMLDSINSGGESDAEANLVSNPVISEVSEPAAPSEVEI